MTLLRVAVLGSGAVTNVLTGPRYKNVRDEIELVGVADLNRQSAEQLLKEFPSAKFYTDYHAYAGGSFVRMRHRGVATFPA